MLSEVFHVKGTKDTLTTWHCFYCLTKKRMYLNFSLVSRVINQVVSIFVESPLCAKNREDGSREKSTLFSQPGCQASFFVPPPSCALQLPGAVCLNHTRQGMAHKNTDLITHCLALTLSGFGMWHLLWFLPGGIISKHKT